MKSSDSEFITIGQILTHWGTKGKLKVKVVTDFPQRFAPSSTVYINQQPTTIDSTEWRKGEAIIKLNLAEGLAGDIKGIEPDEVRPVLPGFSMAEVHVPVGFIGKTIIELNLRNRFGVDVLMIEKAGGPFATDHQEKKRIMPDSNYRFTSGDFLMVFGQTAKVKAFKKIP